MPDTPRPEAETVAPLGAERPTSHLEVTWSAANAVMELYERHQQNGTRLTSDEVKEAIGQFLPPGGWRKAVPADQPDSVAQADIDYIIRWLVQMDDAGIEHTLPKNIRELARRVYERKAVPDGERFDKEKWAVVPRETFEKLRALPGREKYEDGPAEYALEQLAALTARLAEAEAALDKERQAAISIAAACLNAGCAGEDGSTVSAVKQAAAQGVVERARSELSRMSVIAAMGFDPEVRKSYSVEESGEGPTLTLEHVNGDDVTVLYEGPMDADCQPVNWDGVLERYLGPSAVEIIEATSAARQGQECGE